MLNLGAKFDVGFFAAPPLAYAKPASLRLENVTKRYGGAPALSNASLDIAPGEFVTLLGPSGCGKTTLLNLIAGFIEADAGEIFLAGRPITHVPTWEREIGMVFQNYALFPHMTVADNVAYGLRMRGVAKPEIAERVAAALAMVRLEALAGRKPRQLSGGQQQRAALARALVIDPKILLLDEPLSALDKNLRASMQVELRELQRRLGVTTIFVTHDQSEALSLSDRMVVMAEGAIRQIGTPRDIYNQPADRFVASFVGDVSVFRATVTGVEGRRVDVSLGQARLSGAAASYPAARPGDAADIFIRPEALRIAPLMHRSERRLPPDFGRIDAKQRAGAMAHEPGEGVTAPEETVIAYGTVSAVVFQGSHADIWIDTPQAPSGRVLTRVPASDDLVYLPLGGPVHLAMAPDRDVSIFPPEAQ